MNVGELAASSAATSQLDPGMVFDGPVPQDTAVRCLFALVVCQAAIALFRFGARRLSIAHPARHAMLSISEATTEATRRMPWRGFVPTGGIVSTTQTCWALVALVVVNVTLALTGAPHIAGPIARHVPQLHIYATRR